MSDYDDDIDIVVEGNNSVEENILYSPMIRWNIHEGMNDLKLHKMYSLFTKQDSSFYLDRVQAVPEGRTQHYYKFESMSNDHQIILFEPHPNYSASFTTEKSESLGEINDLLETRLSEIKAVCGHINKPTRFIIPTTEESSTLGAAPKHQLLLVMDYDPVKKQLNSTIYDSIGRDTVADKVSKYISGKSQNNSQEVLQKGMDDIFKDSSISVTLNRVAYNHQNRALDGNCGSYAFRAMHEAIQSFAAGKPMNIPERNLAGSTFLTPTHIKEIEECVNYQAINSQDINHDMCTLGMDVASQQEHLRNFISALDGYMKFRNRQSQSILGYNQTEKITAAANLMVVLQALHENRPVEKEALDGVERSLPALKDGKLGKLIQFNLEQNKIPSLIQLMKKVNVLTDEEDDLLADLSTEASDSTEFEIIEPEKKAADKTLSERILVQKHYKEVVLEERVNGIEKEKTTNSDHFNPPLHYN